MDNENVRVALEEMRRSQDATLHAGDMLDQKAAMMMNGAGLIVALFAGLQAGSAKSPIFWALLGLAGLLCIVMFVATQAAAWPRSYHGPIASEWQAIDDNLLRKSTADGLLTLLSGYVTQSVHNKAINQEKARRLRLALILLPVIIGLLVLAAVVA